MEEIPKLQDLPSSSCCSSSSEQKNMGNQQRISVSDHINAFQYTTEKADSFVIDMDAFSSGINIDTSTTNANSRITRSLSRKGSQRVGDKKVNGNATILHDKDAIPAALFSPKGSCTPEKPVVMAVGSSDHSINPHASYHQIANTASNTSSSSTTESKCITRRESFRRSSLWTLDPKRVLLFFATFSSMGTMLLIYFTLTTHKQNADENGSDWKP